MVGVFSKNLHFFHREKTGGITFGDFMEFLSVITKGSAHDKLIWAFTFYDLDRDGVISKDEMLKVRLRFKQRQSINQI